MSYFGAIFIPFIIFLLIKELIRNSLHDSSSKSVAINHGEATMRDHKYMQVDLVYKKPVTYGSIANGDWVCVNCKNEIIEDSCLKERIEFDAKLKEQCIQLGWTAYQSAFKLPNLFASTEHYLVPDETFYIDLTNGDRYVRRVIDGTDWYVSVNTWKFIRPSDWQIGKWNKELQKNGYFWVQRNKTEEEKKPKIRRVNPVGVAISPYNVEITDPSRLQLIDSINADSKGVKVYSIDEALPLVTARMEFVTGRTQEHIHKILSDIDVNAIIDEKYDKNGYMIDKSTMFYDDLRSYNPKLEVKFKHGGRVYSFIGTPKGTYNIIMTDEAHKYAGAPLLSQQYFDNPWCNERGAETYRFYLQNNSEEVMV